MISVALDPSETRPRPSRGEAVASGRPVARILIFAVLGLSGAAAFALGANTMLSGFAGPQRAPRTTAPKTARQGAADWPDLKDGLPALSTGSVTAPSARTETASLAPAEAVAAPKAAAAAPEALKAAPERAPKSLPPIVNVPVIGPSRQATLVAPARAAAIVAPLASETVRARTEGAALAAPPAEKAARVAAAPKADKAAAPDKAAGRKPAVVEAAAASEPAADEDTEVFGLKVPSLAPAGRRIREGVEALGEAVKGLPDRF